MQVFIIRNPTSRAKGLLKTVGVEVDTNIFAANLTRVRVLEVFSCIQEMREEAPSLRLILAESSTGQPGFSLKGLGENPFQNTVLDGVPLTSRKKSPPRKPKRVI